MLSRTGFGNDPRLAHAAGEKDLPHHVIDLVRAGMVQLVALEIDFCPAEMLRQPLREIERAWPSHIMFEEIFELLSEGGVILGLVICLFELQDQRHQCFGNEAPAVDPEKPLSSGPVR